MDATHDLDHADVAHAHDLDADPARARRDAEAARAPGRRTRTDGLQGGGPRASGIVARKADGGNGVHAHAEDALAATAASSGSPLPGQVQRQFEQSLGADLSGVRVHTGSASAHAAKSVSAKAYTVGQDVHFGAGHYDPSSAAGQRLLAHEVAHTVQQAGGAVARKAQFKLDVSTPGDHHELEADRAADAMVSGRSFAVSAGNSTISRVPIETRSNIEIAGDAGAEDPAKYGGLEDSETAGQLRIEGKSDAQKLIGDIQSWNGRLGENHEDDRIEKNQEAVESLQTFVDAADIVGTSIERVPVDVQEDGEGVRTPGSDGHVVSVPGNARWQARADVGANAAEDNAMTASGGAGTDELAERAHKMANADSSQGREILNKLKAVKDQKTALKAAATGVADKGTAVTGSLTALSGAKEELAAIRARSDAKELQEKYDEAMKEYREQKEMVDKLMESIDVIKEGVDFIIAPEEEAPKVATKLVAKAFTAIGHAALDPDPPKDDDKKAAEKKRHDADIKAFNAKTKTYNAAGMAVGEHVKAAVEAVKHLDAMKSKLTTKLKVLGQKMDAADSTQKGKKHKPGEMGTYETIAVFESQADAFLATASATRQLGERDLKDNGKGAGDKDKPTPSAAKTAANALEEANSLTAYRVEDHMVTTTEDDPELTGAEGGGGMPGRTVEVMRAVVVDVPIQIYGDTGEEEDSGGPTTKAGLPGEVEECLGELDGYVKGIKQYRNTLGKAMGLY